MQAVEADTYRRIHQLTLYQAVGRILSGMLHNGLNDNHNPRLFANNALRRLRYQHHRSVFLYYRERLALAMQRRLGRSVYGGRTIHTRLYNALSLSQIPTNVIPDSRQAHLEMLGRLQAIVVDHLQSEYSGKRILQLQPEQLSIAVATRALR